MQSKTVTMPHDLRLSRLAPTAMYCVISVVLAFSLPVASNAESGNMRSIRASAEKGDAQSQHELGRIYELGIGATANPAKAVKWYRRAAEQGLAQAQYSLGRIYFAGDGVARDTRQAVYWLQKAATQDYVLAKNRLGVAYERGQGVPQDYVEAYKWYTLAADATNIAGIVNRDNLKPRMTDKQIAEAKERATATREALTVSSR